MFDVQSLMTARVLFWWMILNSLMLMIIVLVIFYLRVKFIDEYSRTMEHHRSWIHALRANIILNRTIAKDEKHYPKYSNRRYRHFNQGGH